MAYTAPTQTHATVSSAEFMRRVSELVPALRERSAETEASRSLPKQTVDQLVTAGIVRMVQPEEFGGLGLGMEDVVDVGLELGRACGATAWMAVQWPVHNFMIAMFPRSVQETFWADSPDTLASTCSAGPVTLEETPSGARASGTLKLSSGIDWAEWLIVMSEPGMFLLPRSDFEIIDDWHVAGLKGSGSKSVTFRDVLVPTERIVSRELAMAGKTEAAKTQPSPFYRVPLTMWAAPGLSAAVVGMARGAIEQFDVRARTRNVRAGGTAAEQPGTQFRYAEASAQVDTAQLILRAVIREAKQWGLSGNAMPRSEETRLWRDTAFATRLALHAVSGLTDAGDSSAALYDHYPLQRFARDARAAALHPSQAWDDLALQYSRVAWGLEPQVP